MSKGGGGGGSTTTVQKADPWIGLQQPLNKLYNAASANFDRGGPQYYPLQTFANSNPQIEGALNMGQSRAQYGSANNHAAQAQNLSTINGDYLNSNPYLDRAYERSTRPMIDQFKNATMPSIGSQFSMAGRMGSNSHFQAATGAQDALVRGLADTATGIYGGNYDAERNRQQQAVGMAPQLAATDYTDLDKLMGVGQYRQGQEQQGIDANRERYDYYQNLPMQNLQSFNSILNGGMALNGSSTSSKQGAAQRNPFASALGGAAMTNAIGGMMPLGAAGAGLMGLPGIIGGALLGGLFG